MIALININFNLYEVGSLSQHAQILPRSADSKSVHLAPRSLFIPTLPDSHSDIFSLGLGSSRKGIFWADCSQRVKEFGLEVLLSGGLQM